MDCQEESLIQKNRRDEYRYDAGSVREGHLYAMHMVRTQRGRQKISPVPHIGPRKNTRHNVMMARTEGSRHLLQSKSDHGRDQVFNCP